MVEKQTEIKFDKNIATEKLWRKFKTVKMSKAFLFCFLLGEYVNIYINPDKMCISSTFE